MQTASKLWHGPYALAAILLAAAALRFGVRMGLGIDGYWTSGYSLYHDLARELAAGRGFCLRGTCAWVPPLYPMMLAASILLWGTHALPVIALQALIGAATAACAFAIGQRVFDRRVGLLAAAFTAFYPYYVVHDTALQDTSLHALLTATSVTLLLRGAATSRTSCSQASRPLSSMLRRGYLANVSGLLAANKSPPPCALSTAAPVTRWLRTSSGASTSAAVNAMAARTRTRW